ncbi:MAG TPA: hypothetical protein VLV78_04770 [Thermoanaerobaculia bacterium]|nr:hypothetical protein [Thermoanaerobaculia bacterium]
MSECIYCNATADSLEHPLPAAFGEFINAPQLENRICKPCNNTRLGVLDEQLSRCGPEGLLRRHYGITGRANHEPVNPFYRGSAGGHRIEFKTYDEQLGFDVLIECDAGVYRQVRQIIFVEQSGRTHHLPIREGNTPEQLRAAYEELGVKRPAELHFLCDDDEKHWVEPLLIKTFGGTLSSTRAEGSATYNGAIGTVTVTNRYFRAIAKIGFHYFLTQYPGYTGEEENFSKLRTFILDEDSPLERANDFIAKRELPLLQAMLRAGTRPAGWRAHLLAAEIKNGALLGHVQLFITEDWPAPAYTIQLGHGSLLRDRAAGHLYAYYQDGPHGSYAGEAQELATKRTSLVASLSPVITRAHDRC